MNWEGPGIIFRTQKSEEFLRLSVDIVPMILEIYEHNSYVKDNTDLLNALPAFSLSDIPIYRHSVQEVHAQIQQGTLFQNAFERENVLILFIMRKGKIPEETIKSTIELLTNYAEKHQNMIVIISLAAAELKLLQLLEQIPSPNLFITYGFLKKKGKLLHSGPYLLQVLRKEIGSTFLNCSIANRVLADGAEAELKSFKDYLLCIQERRNPILDLKQNGARLMGLYMSDKKTTFNERLITLGIRNFLIQHARKYLYEPNNHNLWKRVDRDITYLLKEIWNIGVLKGDTPEEAFYVICDERNNSSDGKGTYLNILVGIALAKPAQFLEIELQNVVEVLPA